MMSGSSALPRRERRRGERAGRGRSYDLVGAVVRLMPDAAVVVDSAGVIVAANALAESLFGFPPGALAGEVVDNLVPERFRSGHAAHRSGFFEQPSQRPMGAGLELWARNRDGSEFPVEVTLAPLAVPERPLTLAAIRDLTQRRAEWAELGRLAAIVSASDDAIISVDLDAGITSWNQGAQRLFGYGADEVTGVTCEELVPPRLRSELHEQLAIVRAGVRVPGRDTRRLRKNGEEVDVFESLSLIREPSGEAIGFAWLMSDVSERKLAELELRRLLEETQRRERWLEAISDVRLKLLGPGPLDEWLDMIGRHIRELVYNDGWIILIREEEEWMSIAATGGEAFSPAATVALESSPVTQEPASAAPDTDALVRSLAAGSSPLGPLVVSPLVTANGQAGLLAVGRFTGNPEFGREEVRVVESFSQMAGLAVEISQGQSVRDQLALVADRERIARDLHDHVIQRLFAVGMSLQATANSITEDRTLERISESIEEIDATIRDVRSTIFSLELRAKERAETSVRSQILELASKAAETLGFQPRMQFDGPVDTRVPEEMIPDVLAVVRESLSNVAKHARASRVEIGVQVQDDLRVTIADNGRGIGDPERDSGLGNMRARAERRGGQMSITGREPKGTLLEWRVPLPH